MFGLSHGLARVTLRIWVKQPGEGRETKEKNIFYLFIILFIPTPSLAFSLFYIILLSFILFCILLKPSFSVCVSFSWPINHLPNPWSMSLTLFGLWAQFTLSTKFFYFIFHFVVHIFLFGPLPSVKLMTHRPTPPNNHPLACCRIYPILVHLQFVLYILPSALSFSHPFIYLWILQQFCSVSWDQCLRFVLKLTWLKRFGNKVKTKRKMKTERKKSPRSKWK